MNDEPGFWKTRFGMTFAVFLTVGGALLILEHRAHIAEYEDWPILLLLAACIGMHLFMHGSHGHGGHSGHDRSGNTSDNGED